MKLSQIAWNVFAVLALAALLAGCGGMAKAPSAVATLSPSTPIPADASAPPPGPLLAEGQKSGDMLVWLSSNPAQPTPGNAQVEAVLIGLDGKPVTGAKVTYDTDMTNMSHGLYLVQADPAGDGHYTGRLHFSMAGPWRIITIIERPGQPALRLRFEFRVNRS